MIPYSNDKDGLTLWRVVLMKTDYVAYHKKDQDKKEEEEQDQKRKIKRSPVEDFIFKAREELKVTVKEFIYEKGNF